MQGRSIEHLQTSVNSSKSFVNPDPSVEKGLSGTQNAEYRSETRDCERDYKQNQLSWTLWDDGATARGIRLFHGRFLRITLVLTMNNAV